MSEVKHTPGEWIAHADRAGGHTGPPELVFWQVYVPCGRDSGPDDPNRYQICDLGPERSDGTVPHNARLIAASKELLAALQQYRLAQGRLLERWADGDEAVRDELWSNLHDCETAADAAIRKATGT